MKTLIQLIVLIFVSLFTLGILFGDDEPEVKSIRIPAKPSASSGIYVQDYAGVISAPVRNYLQQLGRQLDQKTTAQLVVVTVKSLNGAPLEEYSLKLLRDWGIGNKEKNNGVLMLVSTGDRKSRIEVGYGLEGKLTDSLTGKIQDQYMIPYFRNGTYEEGIAKGYEALARSIAREYNIQLEVSGYANHSPGSVKAGDEGQSTDDLFNKALAEQNGTAVNGASGSGEKTEQGNSTQANVVPSSENPQKGTAESSDRQQGGASLQSNAASGGSEAAPSEEIKPEGVLGFVVYAGEWIVDTFGWVVIVLALVFIDVMFLNGTLTRLLFRILAFFFSGGGGSSGGGYSGGSGGGFGGGSGGGGGSSRSW
jgi:uncharacterized membrane protein YgcG